MSRRALQVRNIASESHSSEALLEAVTACITGILNANSLHEALPRALQWIGRVVRIGRLVIIEKTSSSRKAELTPQIFFIWNSEEAPHALGRR